MFRENEPQFILELQPVLGFDVLFRQPSQASNAGEENPRENQGFSHSGIRGFQRVDSTTRCLPCLPVESNNRPENHQPSVLSVSAHLVELL